MVIHDEFLQSESQLPHVAGALDALCRSLAPGNGHKQKRGQNSNNGGERQKFDQGER